MKKNILTAVTLSILVASGMANAAFTDADAAGNWTGNLEFNGTITNTNPIWQYQIPEATVEASKNWDFQLNTADTEVDGFTTFNIDKNLTLLEGVMKAVTEVPTRGLQPVVAIGTNEAGMNQIVWDTTKPSRENVWMRVSVDSQSGDKNIGHLAFNVTSQVATQSVLNVTNIVADSTYTKSPLAFNLLKSQPYYSTTYSDKAQMGNNPSYATTEPLGANSSAKKLSSGIVATADKFQLQFANGNIPDAWTATIPISITVK